MDRQADHNLPTLILHLRTNNNNNLFFDFKRRFYMKSGVLNQAKSILIHVALSFFVSIWVFHTDLTYLQHNNIQI